MNINQANLNPWAIYRLLPNAQRYLLQRFRRRNDANAYLQVLSRLIPAGQFTIVYEVEAVASEETHL